MISKLLRRLTFRRKLERTAKDEHERAQAALERARAADLHPRQHLAIAQDKALAKLRRRRRQIRDAEETLRSELRLKPERTRISVNRSSRGGVRPRLIVLHITVSHNRPGLEDIDAILEYFDRPSTQASSHIVIDREGHDARCVPDRDKAWTQAAFNPLALSIELIEFDGTLSRDQWLSAERSRQFERAAHWVARWSLTHDIPLTRSTLHGVCQHRDLGAAGGGHSDVSPLFPMDEFLEIARQYRTAYKRT